MEPQNPNQSQGGERTQGGAPDRSTPASKPAPKSSKPQPDYGDQEPSDPRRIDVEALPPAKGPKPRPGKASTPGPGLPDYGDQEPSDPRRIDIEGQPPPKQGPGSKR